MEIQNKNEKSFFRPNGSSPRFRPAATSRPGLACARARTRARSCGPVDRVHAARPAAPVRRCPIARTRPLRGRAASAATGGGRPAGRSPGTGTGTRPGSLPTTP
jgi:hypothetical protein